MKKVLAGLTMAAALMPAMAQAEQGDWVIRMRAAHISPDEDRITGKLAALHFYQLALPAPKPPAGSFNASAAARGEREGRARPEAQTGSRQAPQ